MNFDRYFDWAATAPLDEKLFEKAFERAKTAFANPSSAHDEGAKANAELQAARRLLANSLGADAGQIVFTSGGTESDFLPILSLLQNPSQRGSILYSAVEHPAVREQVLAMRSCGFEPVKVPCGKDGIVRASDVEKKLKPDTVLVCVMAANNETGAIMPSAEIGEMLKSRSAKAKLHIDCVQALGKIPFDLAACKADSAAFSGHKICAVRGIGALYLAKRREPFLRGGGQEGGLRSGTENVLGAADFSLCAQKYGSFCKNENFAKSFLQMQKISQEFCESLAKLGGCKILPECRLERPCDYSPYVLSAAFDGIPGAVFVRAMSAKGFSVSTGAACSSSKKSRPVLDAMGIPSEVSQNSVRFSFGFSTTEDSVGALLEAVQSTLKDFGRG